MIVAEDEIYISDTGRKFGLAGQTLTPRHTIDAILGIKNGDRLLDGKFAIRHANKNTNSADTFLVARQPLCALLSQVVGQSAAVIYISLTADLLAASSLNVKPTRFFFVLAGSPVAHTCLKSVRSDKVLIEKIPSH